jgi:hypothetical protein
MPDHLVLCAARAPDASTGTNAGELERLGIARPSAALSRDACDLASLATMLGQNRHS